MTVRPTVEEFDAFVVGWGPIVRAAAGAEVCAAIDAVFHPAPVEIAPWEDWTWADVQAEIEASSREAVNFAHRIMGEPEVDPWEHANTRAHVESVIEQAWAMVENGQTINLRNR
jgi:hypothetical protein